MTAAPMSPIRIMFVAAALAGALAEYIQERHRLKVIQTLPGKQARDYYESVRDRRERFMVVVTAALVVAAVVAVVSFVRLGP
jgi:hypothetical protein